MERQENLRVPGQRSRLNPWTEDASSSHSPEEPCSSAASAHVHRWLAKYNVLHPIAPSLSGYLVGIEHSDYWKVQTSEHLGLEGGVVNQFRD